ncbi:MAG: hypothetical protein AABO41_10755 [Acidobacteriota bacterium]
MFGIIQKRARARTAAKAPKLHSIAAVMRGRNFVGSFEVAGVNYEFTYSHAKAVLGLVGVSTAALAGRRRLASTRMLSSGSFRNVVAMLSGNLTVVVQRPGLPAIRHGIDNVEATLISAQSGIGTAPPRQKMPADLAPVRPDLPIVESTGALSFCGVLYFKLAPLDGRALGVPADLNALQLNVRLAPVNEAERNLQGAYSSLVDAVFIRKVDVRVAREQVDELNKLLTAG